MTEIFRAIKIVSCVACPARVSDTPLSARCSLSGKLLAYNNYSYIGDKQIPDYCPLDLVKLADEEQSND